MFVRDTPEAAEYATLVEGVPAWLERSLWRSVMDRAVRTPDIGMKAERRLHIVLPSGSGNPQQKFDAYWSGADDRQRLALIDFFLYDLDEAAQRADANHVVPYASYVTELDETLVQGGSVWEVANRPRLGLRRRSNETTKALVDSASLPETDAARKIAMAWHLCYQHVPDYDNAYRHAVLAVEAVALPLVLPNGGTLGKVVAHIRDTATKWTVGALDAPEQATGETLLAMLRTLWHNQERHAYPDGTIHDVSYPEAQTAVTLAVTLVYWFSSGLVSRRPA